MNPGRLLCLVFVTVMLSSHMLLAQNAASEQTKPTYLNPDLPIDQRVNDLVSRMTLEEEISQMQNNAPAIPRLRIPAYGWANEALHGVALAGHATVFPQAIGLAATWDTNLVHGIADVISTEARAKHNDAIQHGNFWRALWSQLLVTQHKYLPRSSMGLRPRDVR